MLKCGQLLQPFDHSILPEDHILKAKREYHFPFHFVVPDRLLVHVCSHPVDNEELRSAHLCLPPSLGDPMLAGDGVSLMDDMAPEMSKIQYIVRTRIVQHHGSGKRVDVADKAVKLRIIPSLEELPPMNVPCGDPDYEVRKVKTVKKGLFKTGTIGRLTAEAVQPRALRLPPPSAQSGTPIGTMTTTIRLRFDPAGQSERPPSLNRLVSKLRVETFFSAACWKDFPRRSTTQPWDTMRDHYSQPLGLPPRCLSTVTWVRHEGDRRASDGDSSRRPSATSTASDSSTSSPSCSATPFWTAAVLIPISLPQNRTFVPTFHSCLVSRTYTLDLNISYVTPGTTATNPTIKLKLPIQISSQGTPAATGEVNISLAEAEEALAAQEVERDFFTPRHVGPPGLERGERSMFADVAVARRATVAGIPQSPEYTERPTYADLGRNGSFATAPPDYHSSFTTRRADPNPNGTIW